MRSIWSAAVVAAGCTWNSAAAQQNVEIGLLACSLSEPIDAETGRSGTMAQERHILCGFRLKNGVEETYIGKVQVVNLSAEEKGTLLWLVKAPPSTPAAPGLVQQSYSADPKTPAGQVPDMIGEANSGIVLQSMADKKEGSAGAREKSPAAGFVVLGVELKLKSTAG